jgi:DNA topoisomerase-3
MIFDVVNASIRSLLNPELTASWEKGLNYVAEGSITSDEYMIKLEDFVTRHTKNVIGLRNQTPLKRCFDMAAANYNMKKKQSRPTNKAKADKHTKK